MVLYSRENWVIGSSDEKQPVRLEIFENLSKICRRGEEIAVLSTPVEFSE